jgi:hypothetical protein
MIKIAREIAIRSLALRAAGELLVPPTRFTLQAGRGAIVAR